MNSFKFMLNAFQNNSKSNKFLGKKYHSFLSKQLFSNECSSFNHMLFLNQFIMQFSLFSVRFFYYFCLLMLMWFEFDSIVLIWMLFFTSDFYFNLFFQKIYNVILVMGKTGSIWLRINLTCLKIVWKKFSIKKSSHVCHTVTQLE